MQIPPLVRVISLIDNLDAFTFLHSPLDSLWCWHFNCVNTVCGSAPLSSSSISISFSCSGGGDFWSSRVISSAFCAAAAAFFYSAVVSAVFLASCASFPLFSPNCAMCSLASSFFFCVADISIAMMCGACHFGGHISSTSKITSSVAMKGNSLH